jgi:hypothetical protein
MSEQNARPYGNSLLMNEIHTMFPAFLYDNEQFHTVNDVFNYVNRQLDDRYNTFNSHRSTYRRRNPRTPIHRRPMPQARQAPRRSQRPYNQSEHIQQSPPYLATHSPPTRSHNDLLANLFAAVLVDPGLVPTSFNDPVLVIPSTQQIATGTTVATAVMNLESPCAVCQDSMVSGNSVRRLNRCTHTFHTACIDTWFQRNVHCPVCRHDIRE